MKLANIDKASWLLLLMLWVITPEIAEASVGTGGGLPYETWLTSLQNSVTGPGRLHAIYHRHCGGRGRADFWRRPQWLFQNLDIYCPGHGLTRRRTKHYVNLICQRCRHYAVGYG